MGTDRGVEDAPRRVAGRVILAVMAAANAAVCGFILSNVLVAVVIFEAILAPAWVLPTRSLLQRKPIHPLFLLPSFGLCAWSVLGVVDAVKNARPGDAGGGWALISAETGYLYAVVLGYLVGIFLMVVGLLVRGTYRIVVALVTRRR